MLKRIGVQEIADRLCDEMDFFEVLVIRYKLLCWKIVAETII